MKNFWELLKRNLWISFRWFHTKIKLNSVVISVIAAVITILLGILTYKLEIAGFKISVLENELSKAQSERIFWTDIESYLREQIKDVSDLKGSSVDFLIALSDYVKVYNEAIFHKSISPRQQALMSGYYFKWLAAYSKIQAARNSLMLRASIFNLQQKMIPHTLEVNNYILLTESNKNLSLWLQHYLNPIDQLFMIIQRVVQQHHPIIIDSLVQQLLGEIGANLIKFDKSFVADWNILLSSNQKVIK